MDDDSSPKFSRREMRRHWRRANRAGLLIGGALGVIAGVNVTLWTEQLWQGWCR